MFLFQYVFDILISSFNHKNWRVREVLMICLTQTINRYAYLTYSKVSNLASNIKQVERINLKCTPKIVTKRLVF